MVGGEAMRRFVLRKFILIAACLAPLSLSQVAASKQSASKPQVDTAATPVNRTQASGSKGLTVEDLERMMMELTAYHNYKQVIDKTRSMVGDRTAQQLAQQHGLNVLNVTWEDTGRYKGSSVGPNISDMTIQVQHRDPATEDYRLHLMPVIRHPNFSDRTADIPLDQFFLLVGNEKGQPLRRVSLREFLGNLRRYLHQPDSWQGRQTSLLADRDTHVLVSAQACFLPVPQGGIAEFNPVLFNYQSYREDFFAIAQELNLELSRSLAILGVVPHHQLPALYRCADGFVLPFESFCQIDNHLLIAMVFEFAHAHVSECQVRLQARILCRHLFQLANSLLRGRPVVIHALPQNEK